MTRQEVLEYSPPLADKLALSTDGGKSPLVRELLKVIRPDIHQQFLRMMLARTNALKNLVDFPIDKITHGTPRHPSLPQSQMARIIAIHAITEDVLPMSLAETVYSFRCDALPEREILVWERIAACLYVATTGRTFSREKRTDIFNVLLSASLGPFTIEQGGDYGALTREEIESLVALYDSDLAALQLVQP